MASEARVENLFGRKFRESVGDGVFTTTCRYMAGSRTMTALATDCSSRRSARSNTFIVWVAKKRRGNVDVASPANFATDVLLGVGCYQSRAEQQCETHASPKTPSDLAVLYAPEHLASKNLDGNPGQLEHFWRYSAFFFRRMTMIPRKTAISVPQTIRTKEVSIVFSFLRQQ